MDTNGPVVLPIYLVFDPASQGTMSLVEFANKLISLVFVGVHADPIMCEGLVVRLIEMQESAVSLLPSNSFLDLVQIPGIVQSSAASLRSVLENLKKWITEDITNLKQQGHRVYRPLVFVFWGGLITTMIGKCSIASSRTEPCLTLRQTSSVLELQMWSHVSSGKSLPLEMMN
jgi:hypothetical protein